MNINRSELMKRAHRIRVTRNIPMSEALKESWIIEKADNYFKVVELSCCLSQTGTMLFNEWEKGFIKSVSYQVKTKELSEKQTAIVEKLYKRIAA